MEKYHENKTPRDEEYVKAYLKYHSQIKAAESCGVGRTTIARAVQRAGIKLDGRKYNNGQLNGQLKVSDAEIVNDAKVLNRVEIADKYNMCVCNVDRRLKRLGIKSKPGYSMQGDRHRYKERTLASGAIYDRSITLVKVYEKYNGICQICGKKTDKNDRCGNSTGKNYPTIDHIKPLSRGGDHSWQNVQLACLSCNSAKCDKY